MTNLAVKRVNIGDVVGGGYGEFWRCKTRYRVLKGGKGSKKSATTALNFIYRLMKYAGSNLLVVRQVMNTHRDSTFAQLKWAQEKLQVAHLWKNTVSPLEMEYLPTGQRILFRGFDDVLKLASATVAKGSLCWVWIEEAYEIMSEADFDKLDLSAPRGVVEPPLYKQTTLTFNPWSETHWLKKRFFDRPAADVATFSTNYLVNEFLDETDRAVFERMREANYRRYDVAGMGNWGVPEGLVYENWSVEPFDAKVLLDGADGWKHRAFFGLDYGYTNDPTAFVALIVNPIDKLVYLYDEIYKTKMLNSDIAAEIISKGYAKERIRADAAEPKSNEDLRRMGIGRIMPSVKGKDSVLNGIAAIQEYKIICHPSCVNTARELSTYRYNTENDTPINKPVDDNNHAMDAMRYAFFDVRFFRPDPNAGRLTPEQRMARLDNMRQEDVMGGWDG